MSKNVLVITDRTDSLWIDQAVKENSLDHSFDVLSLGVSGELSVCLCRDKYEKVPSFNIVDINSFAEAAQEKVRKFVPRFIYEFPRKKFGSNRTLLDLFSLPKFNLWWFMVMPEKGILRSPYIKDLYYLELIRNTLLKKEYNEIWLELDDPDMRKLIESNGEKLPPLRSVIAGRRRSGLVKNMIFWKKVLLAIIKPLTTTYAQKLALRWIGIRKNTDIPEHSVLFFSFFPYFWIRSAQGFFENFFRNATDRVGELSPVRWLVWLSLGPAALLSQRGEIRDASQRSELIFLQQYLSIKDLLRAILISIRYVFRILKYRTDIEPQIKIEYEGFDISTIVISEFHRSLQGIEVIKSVLMEQAIENVLKFRDVSALVYRIEFQPHERAIEYGAKNMCQTIALQHSAIGRNDLQYFFNHLEISGSLSNKLDLRNLPLPDKLLVAGQYPYDIFKNAGFPEANIEICGPVRYASLVEYKRGVKNRAEIRKKYGFNEEQHIFLIAAPSVREDMLSLMLTLLQVLKRVDNDFVFLFKSHPVFKFDREVVALIDQFYPNMKYSFLPDNVNLNDHLFLSDALILTGTTVGIEAICLGIMPILFENSSTFSLNPLLEIKDSYLNVNNVQGLSEALISVVNAAPRILEIKKNWPNAIKKLFDNIEDDPTVKFTDLLVNRGALNK